MASVAVFGGTAEGRLLAEALRDTGLELHICVATDYGARLLPSCPNLHVHTGRLAEEEMEAFLRETGATLCLDATHPYAEAVTANLQEACERLGLEYIRIYRREENSVTGAGVWHVDSPEEAARFLNTASGNVLITTGSKDLEAYTAIDGYQERCFARVLPSPEVMAKCSDLGFSGKHLICMQGPFGEELNYWMIKHTNASWLVTKSSGKKGGFTEKWEAARRAGAGLVVIGRPKEALPEKQMELEEAVALLKERCGLKDRQLYLIGMGPGDRRFLTGEAERCLKDSDVLIGAERILKIWPEYAAKPHLVSYKKEEILAFLREHPEYHKAALVYSGDIGFYSGAKGMREAEGEFELHFIPGISSPLYLLDRLGVPWEEVRLESCHGNGRDLVPLILQNERICALLGKMDTVSAICGELCAFGANNVKVTVGERLSYPEERINTGFPGDFAGKLLDPLSVAYFENPAPVRVIPGIADERFLRGKVPMTKRECRILSLAALGLRPDSVVYDIGAGTGSVSVEAALACPEGKVYAVEKKAEAIELIRQNRIRFRAASLQVVEGTAPEALSDLPAPTHAFIGGSGGNLLPIIRAVREKNRYVRFVLNAVTLETLAALETLKEEFPEYGDMEVTQISAAKGRPLGRYHIMTAENPVFIVSFGGNEEEHGEADTDGKE